MPELANDLGLSKKIVNVKASGIRIFDNKVSTIPKKIKVEYGILINYALTVTEVNAMLVGTLNGIPVKSLSSNNSSFEMIPIRNL